jgi:hypothetical protein
MTTVVAFVKRCGAWRAPQWYCLLVAAFLAIRAVTTLAASASFAFPGDGWRSVFQLIVAGVLLLGIANRRSAAAAVLAVAVVYAVLTLLELFHGADILGVIPVDARDRYVHPLLAIAALACLVADRRKSRQALA